MAVSADTALSPERPSGRGTLFTEGLIEGSRGSGSTPLDNPMDTPLGSPFSPLLMLLSLAQQVSCTASESETGS